LQQEEQHIHDEINGNVLSVVFDGTAHLGEALAIILTFVSDDWQCLVKVQLLTKSLTGEEIAREFINIPSSHYGVQPTQLLGAMRDRASTNNVAMQTMKIVYSDMGCYSHMIDQVGNCFNTTTLNDFMSAWIGMFSHSFKARALWRERADNSCEVLFSNKMVEQMGGDVAADGIF